jgi:hypothetical protein
MRGAEYQQGMPRSASSLHDGGEMCGNNNFNAATGVQKNRVGSRSTVPRHQMCRSSLLCFREWCWPVISPLLFSRRFDLGLLSSCCSSPAIHSISPPSFGLGGARSVIARRVEFAPNEKPCFCLGANPDSAEKENKPGETTNSDRVEHGQTIIIPT